MLLNSRYFFIIPVKILKFYSAALPLSNKTAYLYIKY